MNQMNINRADYERLIAEDIAWLNDATATARGDLERAHIIRVLRTSIEHEYAIKHPEQDAVLDEAWGIIANAHNGNWEVGSLEWKKAAEAWRERYRRLRYPEPRLPWRSEVSLPPQTASSATVYDISAIVHKYMAHPSSDLITALAEHVEAIKIDRDEADRTRHESYTERGVLARRVGVLQQLVKEALEALEWCSGASDFQKGAPAEKGWEKLQPLIDRLHACEAQPDPLPFSWAEPAQKEEPSRPKSRLNDIERRLAACEGALAVLGLEAAPADALRIRIERLEHVTRIDGVRIERLERVTRIDAAGTVGGAHAQVDAPKTEHPLTEIELRHLQLREIRALLKLTREATHEAVVLALIEIGQTDKRIEVDALPERYRYSAKIALGRR